MYELFFILYPSPVSVFYSVCGIVGAHITMRLPLPLHLCIFLLSRSISSKISLFVPTGLRPRGLFVSESGCKSTALPASHQIFSHLFFALFHNRLCFSEKNFGTVSHSPHFTSQTFQECGQSPCIIIVYQGNSFPICLAAFPESLVIPLQITGGQCASL